MTTVNNKYLCVYLDEICSGCDAGKLLFGDATVKWLASCHGALSNAELRGPPSTKHILSAAPKAFRVICLFNLLCLS